MLHIMYMCMHYLCHSIVIILSVQNATLYMYAAQFITVTHALLLNKHDM